MKKIQLKYILLSILFWAMGSTVGGFSTVFMKEHGISNTEIGIVKGISCVLIIFIPPMITTLVHRKKGLSSRKLFLMVSLVVACMVVLLSLDFIPINLMMLLYLIIMLLQMTLLPLFTNMAMEYIQAGENINYGLSRGIGSLAFATSALFVSRWIERFGADVIMRISLILLLLIIGLVLTMKDGVVLSAEKKGTVSFRVFAGKYFWFLILMSGFALTYGVAAAQDTYMINIINNLGGDTAFLGVAVFFGAMTEMPMMALVPWLKKRFSSSTLLSFSAVSYIFRNILICVAPNLTIFMVGEFFQGAAFGLFTAVIAYYVAEQLELEDQVLGQTCFTIFTGGIGATIGNVLGGVLQDVWGLQTLFAVLCVITVIGSSIVLIQLHRVSRKR